MREFFYSAVSVKSAQTIYIAPFPRMLYDGLVWVVNTLTVAFTIVRSNANPLRRLVPLCNLGANNLPLSCLCQLKTIKGEENSDFGFFFENRSHSAKHPEAMLVPKRIGFLRFSEHLPSGPDVAMVSHCLLSLLTFTK